VLLTENNVWVNEERSMSESTREGDTTARGEESTKRYDANVLTVGCC
jgi:hypothetical protein